MLPFLDFSVVWSRCRECSGRRLEYFHFSKLISVGDTKIQNREVDGSKKNLSVCDPCLANKQSID